MKRHVCCICGKEFEGWGNNAWPYEGECCCEECNSTKVIPARLLDGQAMRVIKLMKENGSEDVRRDVMTAGRNGFIPKPMCDHILDNFERLEALMAKESR